MNLQRTSERIVRRLTARALNCVGRDSVSLAKIRGRKDLTKIGTTYGGWVIPKDLLHSNAICYCAGCGEDISFDLGVIDTFGCDIFAFDPTPRSIAYVAEAAARNTKYHFFDVGLWDKEDTLKFFVPKDAAHVSHSLVNLQKTDDHILVKVRRLADIMEELGHKHVDLLKLDVEGAEYRVLQSILDDRLDIKVICVEYDECFNPLDGAFKSRICESIERLLVAGYAMVCVQGHGNYTFVKD